MTRISCASSTGGRARTTTWADADVERRTPASTARVEGGHTREVAMKYLVMIYSNPASRAAWEGFSDADKARGLKVYAQLVEELAGTGELVVTEALADPSQARRPF